jgi:hypothetical protein
VCPRVVILFESDADTDEEGWSLAGKHQTVLQIGPWTRVQEPKKVRSPPDTLQIFNASEEFGTND